MIEPIAKTGVVIIGRNEGQRLINCVQSFTHTQFPIVYVDSNSTDGSTEFCRSQNITVVELDMSIPFTAARARNEGYRALKQLCPEISYVQFIDGDCTIDSNWPNQAIKFLSKNTKYAAVCGRRSELYPESSIYNLLCDIEWNTPIGEAKTIGGDALVRIEAFESVNGFNSSIIAGEEPELCFRLRQKDWKIYRLEADMTFHDAAILRFSQWWKRSKRAGYAYTNGAIMHGLSKERYNVRPVFRILFWAALLPLIILLAAITHPSGLIIALIYPLQYLKLVINGPSNLETNLKWSFFIQIGKFSEFAGLIKCFIDKLLSRDKHIIEYK